MPGHGRKGDNGEDKMKCIVEEGNSDEEEKGEEYHPSRQKISKKCHKCSEILFLYPIIWFPFFLGLFMFFYVILKAIIPNEFAFLASSILMVPYGAIIGYKCA